MIEIRADIQQQFGQKANLSDMKRTMTEVANNIENRTTFADVKRMIELKVERSEVQYMLTKEIDERLRGIEQQRFNNPKQDEINEEIRTMKRKLEDAVYDMSKQARNQPVGSSSTVDPRVLEQFESRLNDLQIQIDNKASEDRVARALHEKASRKDIDELVNSKADLNALNNVLQSLEMKADQRELEKISRAIDNKADKYEL